MKNTKRKNVSDCCGSETIPPDLEMAEEMGSMWRAYACHICKNCHRACGIKKTLKT